MIKLTDKQRQAVFTRDCDILVSAAAGSGKTAVLSERILQAIMNPDCPASVNDFLVVTFTNAAASEMKDRISKKIMETASDFAISNDIRNHLRRQLSLLGKASITTIHAFCLDIIKNNFHLLDIDPAVRVADKNESEILKLQAAEKMLEQMYAEDGELFAEVTKWISGASDEKFIVALIEIYNFLRGFPAPIKWLESKIEDYNPQKVTDLSEVLWCTMLVSRGKNELIHLIRRAQKLLDKTEENGIDPYAQTVLSDIEILKEYLAFFDGGIKALLKKVPEFLPANKRPKDTDADLCKILLKERNDIKDAATAVSGCFDFTEEEFFAQLEKVYPRLLCFGKSIKVFDEIFKEEKKKAAIIDFSDFEHLALEILSDNENGVADRLREKYTEIMIDEYQDCNQTQETLFSYINRKIDGKSSNMFMVGDIKQSIYRFRLADPDIFGDKNRRYVCDGMQRKIVLNNNFRSSATILDGVNSVFEKIMTEKSGGVDYSDEEKLYFKNDNPDKDSEEKCELAVVDRSLCEGEISSDEADYIAERITELVNSGYNFRDIAILVKSVKNKAADIERALKARNIPFFTDGGSGQFESLEIGMLTNLLKVIDNPMQDIELAALLRSPVFSFDENALAEIRLEKKGPFYGALIKYASGDGKYAYKCQAFLNRLSEWRDKVLFMPVDEFIEYLISDSGLDVFATSLAGGEQRIANLKLLVLQARLLQKSGFKGLFSFVSYIDRLSAGGDGMEAKLLSENSNVVRILTIHKSKGLEFPVVFLYGCDSAFINSDSGGNIVLHKNAGIGIKFLDAKRKIRYPLVSYEAVKNKIIEENISEQMRVLYVALTRAKQKLICTATVKDFEKRIDKIAVGENATVHETLSTKNFLDWIVRGADDNWKISVVSPDEISLTHLEEKIEKNTVGECDDISEIEEIFEYKYPFEKATTLPTKLSVSEVKRRREHESAGETRLYVPEISPEPEFLSEREVSAAEKGIINHLVLRHINHKTPDVDGCITELANKGLMSEEDCCHVDREGINSFFESDLGHRLKKAELVKKELSFGISMTAEELFPGQGYGGETVMIQGIIDLVFISENKTVIVDYKTDKVLDGERKAMYKTQLELYSKAAEKILGRKIDELYLFMLSRKECIRF